MIPPPTILQVTRTERGLGRLELLSWLNQTLSTDYAQIQDCADGVAYCQLVDSVLPGKVPLHKLNFNAQFYEDNVKNLRVLESTLPKLGVKKQLDVEALAKGRFKENNEMLQWCYTFVQKNCPEAAIKYNALERRMEAKARQRAPPGAGRASHHPPGSPQAYNPHLQQDQMPNRGRGVQVSPGEVQRLLTASGGGGGGAIPCSAANLLPPAAAAAAAASGRGSPLKGSTTRAQLYAGESKIPRASPPRGAAATAVGSEGTGGSKRAELENLVRFLEQELMGRLHAHIAQQAEVRALERERNFYLDKLHRIEEACNHGLQHTRSVPLAQQTLQILSARS